MSRFTTYPSDRSNFITDVCPAVSLQTRPFHAEFEGSWRSSDPVILAVRMASLRLIRQC
jgi:hypothetical protein